ncbi:ribosomal protein S5 domain 2-like protein [Cylindrobasidium torrendii FP15055 ss-10]|uniref:Ribosomal protein S5 domain 2-like protein n=1 Tax=Cylindrobasidium torrendii FP15055 ss-10 TaxID=1314674 RepID=A0A0D7BII9_9AGAR|nr:ribosomal protein S5 domain 2-like protein [Cylindrobasidium torrendii FP15055 ss-10]
MERILADLQAQPEREAVASELEVLESIYGPEALQAWQPAPVHSKTPRDGTLRYEVNLNFPEPYEDVTIKVLVSIPADYPAASPPQLQLLSRYIGAYGADTALFSTVLKTFMSVNGVEWSPDLVCVFDGLQNVLERCVEWYEEHLSLGKAGEILRDDEKEAQHPIDPAPKATEPVEDEIDHSQPADLSDLPDGLQMYESEPIVDRKSVFVGRACAITDPSQVPIILSALLSDRRVARAAHPIINAWRCQVGTVLHQDNDDDGETAAGGRLAHLLQILEVNNVLVVVSRYFGGLHIGPDRFKHINQCARNALELGGFLEGVADSHKKQRGRK